MSKKDDALTSAPTDAPSAGAVDAPAPASEIADLGLPKWLSDLLEPGVGPGVFAALKLSIVALIICLLFMLYFIENPVRLRAGVERAGEKGRAASIRAAAAPPQDLRFHLKIFLGMATVLLVLIIWCAARP